MNNSYEDEFSVALRVFTEMLGWQKAEVDALRQDLIKAGLIFKIGSDEFVSAVQFGEYVDNELDKLASKFAKSNSDEDIANYTLVSLSYLRSWFFYLAAIDFSSAAHDTKDIVAAGLPTLKTQLTYYHKIYKHLLNALEISFGIGTSKTKDVELNETELAFDNPPGKVFDKKKLFEDKDLASVAIPLEMFNSVLRLAGSEITQRHQDMGEQDVIVEKRGEKFVILTRYASYVLVNLEHLRHGIGTIRSESALEDYAFFSFQYLYIWINLLGGMAKEETTNSDGVSDEIIKKGWEYAIDCFRAIYRYTLDAIIISFENGLSKATRRN